MIMSKKQEYKNILNFENARRKDQKDLMKIIKDDGICPFCKENLEKYHPKPILFKTKKWIVTENAFPYTGTSNHILCIYKKHIEDSKDIDGEGWSEIGEIMTRLNEDLEIDSGTMIMRFGDTTKTGATVNHVHFHLTQANPENPDYPEGGIITRIG